jgi:hypothetical protein
MVDSGVVRFFLDSVARPHLGFGDWLSAEEESVLEKSTHTCLVQLCGTKSGASQEGGSGLRRCSSVAAARPRAMRSGLPAVAMARAAVPGTGSLPRAGSAPLVGHRFAMPPHSAGRSRRSSPGGRRHRSAFLVRA